MRRMNPELDKLPPLRKELLPKLAKMVAAELKRQWELNDPSVPPKER